MVLPVLISNTVETPAVATVAGPSNSEQPPRRANATTRVIWPNRLPCMAYLLSPQQDALMHTALHQDEDVLGFAPRAHHLEHCFGTVSNGLAQGFALARLAVGCDGHRSSFRRRGAGGGRWNRLDQTYDRRHPHSSPPAHRAFRR